MAILKRKTSSGWTTVASEFPVDIPIQIGGNVQTYSGTFSTNSGGTATVNCGFQPDIVVVDIGTAVIEGYTYHTSLTFPLCIDRTNLHELCAWGENLGINMIDGIVESKSTGFGILLNEVTENWDWVTYANKGPFNVTAYKFL